MCKIWTGASLVLCKHVQTSTLSPTFHKKFPSKIFFARTRSGSPTAATIHIKPAGLEIEGLPCCRASGHKDVHVLSGDTSSAPPSATDVDAEPETKP
jgi:hypothetical protein